MDREVFALLKGLPAFITDIIPYLCDGNKQRVVGAAAFLAHETHTRSCPQLLGEAEFLPLPQIPHTMARYRLTCQDDSSAAPTEPCYSAQQPRTMNQLALLSPHAIRTLQTHLCE